MNEYLMSSTFCTSGSVPISDVRISEASMYFKYRYKIHNNCVVTCILTVKVKRNLQLRRNSLFNVVVVVFLKSFNLDEHWPPGNSGNKINGLYFFPPTIICDSGRILPCEVAIHNPRRRMHIVLTCEWRYPLIGPDQEKIQSPMRPAYRAEKFQLSKRNR